MLNKSLVTATVLVSAATLGGCYTYPVYQPVPVARLSPAQTAALPTRPLTQAEQDSYAAANAQAQREDLAAQPVVVQPYAYGYDYPYYGGYGYYGYPSAYYGGFYPWVPGLSLSFGYRGGFGGGYRGGYRGGYHGGGGFHGRR